jgi:hypothetical protein
MKKLSMALLLTLAGLLPACADEARFFRISGPVASTIIALDTSGYLTWTNAATNAVFTIQTAGSLAGLSNWVDYIQVPLLTQL